MSGMRGLFRSFRERGRMRLGLRRSQTGSRHRWRSLAASLVLAGGTLAGAAGCAPADSDLDALLSAIVKIASNPSNPPIGDLTVEEWVAITRNLSEIARRFPEIHLPLDQLAEIQPMTELQAEGVVAYLDARGINTLDDMESQVAYVIPDQSQFVSLDSLSGSGEALVRLYAAPVLGTRNVAIHAWFIVKHADSTVFHRWEGWEFSSEPYGYVGLDQVPLDYDLGTGDHVVAELRGTDAERVIAFIELQSPSYPCRNEYAWFPGPNSNTYVQWVLNGSGWNVDLSPAALGADYVANCTSAEPAP